MKPIAGSSAAARRADVPQSATGASSGRLVGGDRLSTEAQRLCDLLQLPIRLLPSIPPAQDSLGALHRSSLEINRLISGHSLCTVAAELAERFLAHGPARRFTAALRADFAPLWSRDEVPALGSGGARRLDREWRRRATTSPLWRPAWAAIRSQVDYPQAWEGLPVGDFELSGRGDDYTRGMQYFQAARTVGVEALLALLPGAVNGRPPLHLDVLGGDGYILRIAEAGRSLRRRRLLALDVAAPLFEAVPEEALAPPAASASAQLLVTLRCGAGGEARFRVAGVDRHSSVLSAPFRLDAGRQARLLAEARGGRGEAPIARRDQLAEEIAAAAADGEARPLVLTNDLSLHMFLGAGAWGLPTREDGRLLARTFRRSSLDGVLFAYGTHHIAGLDQAIRQSHQILRPGGVVVVHDFLDEGQVGRWFHQVVHRRSRTGHDFPHLSPLQLTAYLLTAGFRDVHLYEMPDPFVFAVPPRCGVSARDIACTYLLGMYGMTESFQGRRDGFEQVLAEILCYPEIGDVPRFGDDVVYVPRRALVAAARRPEHGEAAGPLSPSDAALAAAASRWLGSTPEEVVARCAVDGEVAASWFPGAGRMWGLSPAERAAWFRWLDGVAQ